jgi:hypothetical protein
MTAMCYTCKTRPAGNDYAGPYSAYCGTCQPRDIRPQPRGSQCGCGACGRIFATLTDSDAHQERWPRGHDLEGVFTGQCADPAVLGLELAAGVWGTQAGNAHRASLADRFASRGTQTGEQSAAHISGTPRAVSAPQSQDAA